MFMHPVEMLERLQAQRNQVVLLLANPEGVEVMEIIRSGVD